MKRSLEIDLGKCTTDEEREKCLQIAECLVGSKTKGERLLVGVHECDPLRKGQFRTQCPSGYSERASGLTIPLDTMQFCPFMAMREKVCVIGSHKLRGLITEITENVDPCAGGDLFQVDWSHIWAFKEDITLDLTPIEAGEIVGCRIVEVE